MKAVGERVVDEGYNEQSGSKDEGDGEPDCDGRVAEKPGNVGVTGLVRRGLGFDVGGSCFTLFGVGLSEGRAAGAAESVEDVAGTIDRVPISETIPSGRSPCEIARLWVFRVIEVGEGI